MTGDGSRGWDPLLHLLMARSFSASAAGVLFWAEGWLFYIQELLGHDSIETTERYTHVIQRGLEQVKSLKESLLGGRHQNGELRAVDIVYCALLFACAG